MLKDNLLKNTFPELFSEWNYDKNSDSLSLEKVTAGSSLKVWWICKKGHEWEAIIANRAKGNGCPYCSGKKVTDETSLQFLYPNLAKEWHPTKNGKLTPKDLTRGSGKKVWWKCEKDHEWQAVVRNRSGGTGCPDCGKKALADKRRSWYMNYPDIVREWHPTKNGTLQPNEVSVSYKKYIWWKCINCTNEWRAKLNSRVKSECPDCGKHKRVNSNIINKIAIRGSLLTVNPKLAKDWHPVRNNELTPQDVTPSSSKVVWWQCEKKHEWKTSISNRNRYNHGCPYCKGKKAWSENSLENNSSEFILGEWDYKKNSITPEEVTPFSHQKVWWICSKGHSWKAAISHRSNGRNCPICNKERSTSFQEQIFYFYLKSIFQNCENRFVFSELESSPEADIYIPQLNLVIEYDGIFFHKNKVQQDEKKNRIFKQNDIVLIRIRETERGEKLPEIDSSNCKLINCEYGGNNSIKNSLMEIFEFIKTEIGITVEENKKMEDLIKNIDIEKDKISIAKNFINNTKEDSLLLKNPQLAKQWNYEKNENLLPEYFKPQSNKKVWWKCEKGHEWISSIGNRIKGRSCPYCSGKKVTVETSLLYLFPEISKEWDSLKNLGLLPSDVTKSSNKKVWWKCEKGHEWETVIAHRTNGTGCPFCSGKKATFDTSLQSLFPEIAREWHPTKNGKLTPNSVTRGSGKKIWWKCKNGHEWEAQIIKRTSRNNRCPYCRT